MLTALLAAVLSAAPACSDTSVQSSGPPTLAQQPAQHDASGDIVSAVAEVNEYGWASAVVVVHNPHDTPQRYRVDFEAVLPPGAAREGLKGWFDIEWLAPNQTVTRTIQLSEVPEGADVTELDVTFASRTEAETGNVEDVDITEVSPSQPDEVLSLINVAVQNNSDAEVHVEGIVVAETADGATLFGSGVFTASVKPGTAEWGSAILSQVAPPDATLRVVHVALSGEQ